MSMLCAVCVQPVYLAEQKVYEGKTFHGLCFGIWKKQKDFEHNQEVRHAEYHKTADVAPTKVRISNYNNFVYATQYDPTGTVPASAFTNTGFVMTNTSTPHHHHSHSHSASTLTNPHLTAMARSAVATAYRRQDYSRRGTYPFPRRHSGTFTGAWTY